MVFAPAPESYKLLLLGVVFAVLGTFVVDLSWRTFHKLGWVKNDNKKLENLLVVMGTDEGSKE